jgi:hypothetical protein
MKAANPICSSYPELIRRLVLSWHDEGKRHFVLAETGHFRGSGAHLVKHNAIVFTWMDQKIKRCVEHAGATDGSLHARTSGV